jgi:hypothetical protein
LGLKLFDVSLHVVVLLHRWRTKNVTSEASNLRNTAVTKKISAASLLVFAKVVQVFVISTRKATPRVGATVGEKVELSHLVSF